MLKMVYSIRLFFEKHEFYVSARFVDWLGIRAKNVRLLFIYRFATVGIVFYIILAFLLRLKDLFYTKQGIRFMEPLKQKKHTAFGDLYKFLLGQ